MSLSPKSIKDICTLVNRGAKIVVGRDPDGNRKIKVYRWPLGLFPKRWKCTEAEFNALRQNLQATAPARPATFQPGPNDLT